MNEERIKKNLLEMLKIVHELCEKNKIPYYIIGGTFLGAVRHKGFIPWDDDIDIAIPRPYFNRFIEICKKNLTGKYSIDLYKQLKNNDKYFFYYSKVRDNSIRVFEEKYGSDADYSGIWIDAFAIDGVPNGKIKYNIFKFKLSFLRMLKSFSQIQYIRRLDNRSKFQKFLIKFAQVTKIGKLINQEKIIKRINKILNSNSYEKCKNVGTVFGSYGFNEVVPKDFFGKPTHYSFENIEVYGPQKYDEYLTSIYGNYMELPPEEKRIPLHYKEVIFEKKGCE